MPRSDLPPPPARRVPALLRRIRAGLALALLVGLAACAPQASPPYPVGVAPPIGGTFRPAPEAVQRAGLLLPLSGPQAPLGRAMLNAGTMALFDEAPFGVEFLPRDTGGTPAGAAAAARAAIADGARVLVGPLTSAEAGAVIPVARAAGVPVLAFTNDAQRAGEGAWVLGTTPAQQVRRVVAAAARDGAQRFALAAPDNEFGRALATALRGATSDLGLPSPAISLHPASADPVMAAGAARARAAEADALLIGEGGDRARRFAAAWAVETVDNPMPARLLGTAIWMADPAIRNEPALAGAWFAGPDPRARARFEDRYREAFRDVPPRVAAAAYDGAALAARTLRGQVPPGAGTAALSGAELQGADGPVRLMPGGRTLRGLAVYALSPTGEMLLIEPAPDPGAAGS